MTFAIAALSPLPLLDGWIPQEFLSTSGIVLLADTRYTLSNGKQFDRGVKIMRLGRYAGCVGAGNVDSFRRAVALLRPFFKEHPKPLLDHAEESITRALDSLRNQLPSNDATMFPALGIGYVSADSRSHIHAWAPTGTLAKRSWGFAFGQFQYADLYEWIMQQRVSSARHRGKVGLTPDATMLEYAIGLHDLFMETNVERSVGGALQAAIITPTDGYDSRRISFGVSTGIDDPPLRFHLKTPPDLSFDWRRTPPPASVPHERAVLAVAMKRRPRKRPAK